tara:strand:+ start:6425 stop:6673 length:249 start_codon:yes stop_codon:yes gene_type:complete
MEELIVPVLRIAGHILSFCLEFFVYEVFYYIGVMPVWVITFGRFPTKPPWQLNKANRIIYGIIGFLFSVACFVYYLNLANGQ